MNKYQVLLNKLRTPEFICTALAAVAVCLVTCFPLTHPGIYGYMPDVLYHLNRVEGVRTALMSGAWPAEIYTNFFDGMGYGSPMFYPDLLLLIPALLRLIGLSPLQAYKATVALFSVILTIVSERCFRRIAVRFETALAAALLFVLSQFVLADIIVRAGFSSYLSYIFLPMLAAGLHDFFEREGRHTGLLAAAFTGLILTHTLNAFQAVLLTVLITVIMLFTKEGRAAFTDKKRLLRLVNAVIITILLTAWYWIPMLEQMLSGTDFIYRHPWADIGEFTQPWEDFFDLTGYFFNIAHVGIGIPVIAFAAARVFAKKPENADQRFGDICYVLGVLLFAAMTDIVPWQLLSKTILGNLQFTFRIYPYALLLLCFGLVTVFDRILEYAGSSSKKNRRLTAMPLLITAAALSIIFGVIQNRTVTGNPDGFSEINEEVLAEYSGEVGRGEWLPAQYDREADHEEVFDQDGLEVPSRIWYKGYKAYVTTDSGERKKLDTEAGDDGLARVINPDNLTGTVELVYKRTACRIVSMLATAGGIVWLIVVYVRKRKRGAKPASK